MICHKRRSNWSPLTNRTRSASISLVNRMTINVVARLCVLILLLAGLSGDVIGAIRFGPYEAVMINSEVIHGVKVDDERRIWLLVNPDYLDQDIVVKVSTEQSAGYREWQSGGFELVSPAGKEEKANQWTNPIQVRAPFIEYWMSGRLILHLKRIE